MATALYFDLAKLMDCSELCCSQGQTSYSLIGDGECRLCSSCLARVEASIRTPGARLNLAKLEFASTISRMHPEKDQSSPFEMQMRRVPSLRTTSRHGDATRTRDSS